jgi:hypothetical protein
MLSFPAGVRLYLATEPTDLRKSFSGLSMLVEHTFGLDAMAGHLFVFLNRRGNQVRIPLLGSRRFLHRREEALPQLHPRLEPHPESLLPPASYFA